MSVLALWAQSKPNNCGYTAKYESLVGSLNLSVPAIVVLSPVFLPIQRAYLVCSMCKDYSLNNREVRMDKCKAGAGMASGGVIWFIGWLFTITFVQLSFWKIVLGIFVWPLYLGEAIRLLT